MRELSAKMPSMVDSTLPSRDPATREGDTQQTGDNGPMTAAPIPTSLETDHGAHDVEWENLGDNKPGWEIGADEQKGPTWEVQDRMDENDESVEQRPVNEAGPEPDQSV